MCNKVFLSTVCLGSTDESNMRSHCGGVADSCHCGQSKACCGLSDVTVGKWKHGCGYVEV